ncbi:NB-ARC domain-containing protein [Micromonospora chersina]|uniref:NB-ARC domain-containing protein n=1 Tax=Micromonospora chersina TaxID=47854 RepID=UPI0034555FFA
MFDLLCVGEMAIKLAVAGLLAGVEEERDRHRYRLEHALVRASGVGDWVRALTDVLTGPASQYLAEAASGAKRDLMKNLSGVDDSWQRSCVQDLAVVCRVLGDDFPPLAAKPSLRWWFDAFAWLRNRTRGHGAMRGADAAKICERLDSSLRTLTDNFAIYQLPWVYLHRTLKGKFRVIPVSGDSSSLNYLKSEKHHDYQDGLYVEIGGLRKVSLVHTDLDLADFYFANGGFRESASRVSYETLSYISDSRQQANGANFLSPPTPLPPSETEGGSALEVLGKSFANVPPKTRDYVARVELEEELLELLRNDRHPIITLVGRGGIGKTSLALEVAHQLAEQGDFFTVVWLSARDIDLQAHGPKVVVPKVRTVQEVAAEFTRLFASQGSRKGGVKAVEHLTRAMAENGGDSRILFVFDNFETMQSPAEMYQLIDTYIRLPNKVLITSRRREFKADYPVHVGGMRRLQFDELVRTTAAKLEIGNLLTSSYVEELFDETDGHPYVVKVLLGDVSRTRHVGKVRRVIASHDGILDALFERTFSSVSPAARRVFLTLCNWKSMVPRLAVEGTLLRPSNEPMDVEEAIDVLERSSLIEIFRDGESGQEFIQVPLAAQVFGSRKLRVSPMRPAVDADTEILQSFGAMQAVDVAKGLDPRIERMVRALSEQMQSEKSIGDKMAVLEYLASHYPKTWLSIARLYFEAATPELQQKSLVSIERYLELNPQDVEAWRYYVKTARHVKDHVREINALLRIAELPDSAYEDISVAANVLNRYLSERLLMVDGDEKKAMIDRIAGLMRSRISEANSTDYSRLAWLYLNLNEAEQAMLLAGKGLELDPANTHCLRLTQRARVSASSLIPVQRQGVEPS